MPYKDLEKRKATQKAYSLTPAFRASQKAYQQTSKYRITRKRYQKKYAQTLRRKEYLKRYRQTSKFKERQKAYRQTPRFKVSQMRYNRSPQRKEYMRVYQKERIRGDDQFKLLSLLRNRTRSFLKGKSKSSRTLELVGCSLEELRAHIERQFTEGMSWDNWGRYGWHLDHVIPPSRFDLTDPNEQKRLFHFTNLQPLWWKENIQKSDKLPEEMAAIK